VRNHQVLSFSGAAASVAIRAGGLDPVDAIDGMVGRTAALGQTLERLRRVASTDTTVLITGETGTGKELVARAIHRRSRRASRPLVTAHLAAVPESLVGSELFGHERGAFTGADRTRIGRFELADQGTLFLDEVGELRAEVQVALLRALQEGEYERVGASQTRRIDVRVIAATNRDLNQAMHEGRFRHDLFHRLGVFPIHLPPLRDRRDDIPTLAEHFLAQVSARLGRRFAGIERSSLDCLMAADWPGNIRQLQNVIEHSAILCDGPLLRIPPDVVTEAKPTVEPAGPPPTVFDGSPTLEEVKKRYISLLLSNTHGNLSRAAAILDVDRRSLYRMIDRYHLEPRRPGRNDAEGSAIASVPGQA
jgi:transcriptional regulator with GAF, ATPase, and Fis domain